MRILSSIGGLAILLSALWASDTALAQSPPAPFPDVPPWHWAYQAVLKDEQAGLVIGYPSSPAELVATSITQVYDSFVHAHATGAQAWAERFTYDRPSSWPGPLDRSQVTAFTLTGMRPVVTGDTATATFNASVTTAGAGTAVTPMRVTLRLMEGDWKIDYATLAQASPLFR